MRINAADCGNGDVLKVIKRRRFGSHALGCNKAQQTRFLDGGLRGWQNLD